MPYTIAVVASDISLGDRTHGSPMTTKAASERRLRVHRRTTSSSRSSAGMGRTSLVARQLPTASSSVRPVRARCNSSTPTMIRTRIPSATAGDDSAHSTD